MRNLLIAARIHVAAVALLTLGVAAIPSHAVLMVTPSSDANALANTILGAGVTITSATFTGAAGSAGTFVGGTGVGPTPLPVGLGIESGIILTTGLATTAEGPNVEDDAGTSHFTAGDADLSALAGGAITNDAAILEITFETTSGNIFFNYAFGSEEYNEFTNTSFNDVFGLFLDGVNIALLPDGVTPVSINSINGGNPLGTGAANPAFFNNNDLTDGGPFFDIEYDGFTDVFTASAIGLAPGPHTLKFAIADVSDFIYDSGVFIEAGSLTGDPPAPGVVPEPASVVIWSLMAVGICGVLRLRKKQS